MAREEYISPAKFLVLTTPGVVPTVPVPVTLRRFHKDFLDTDLEMGTWARNLVDGKLFYRSSVGIEEFPDAVFGPEAAAYHNHDDRYYTKTQLNAGQLNNIYYTETEMDILLSYKAPLESPVFTTKITTPVIYGSAAANGDISIEGTIHATKTTSYVLLQPNGGNVGIGTDTPETLLHIKKAGACYARIESTVAGQNAQFYFMTTVSQFGIGANMTSVLGDFEIYDYYAGASRFYLPAHGNVGAGNIGIGGFFAPLSKLCINGGLHVGGESDAGDNNMIVDGTSTFYGNLNSNDWVSQLTGWGIYTMADGRKGGADFRYIYVDEMHAKRFVADLEQALAGGQIISKSVAILHADVVIPAKGASVQIEVEDLPGSTANVFVDNDWVQLRLFDRTGGGLTIANAYGQVTFVDHHDAAGDEPGYQHWTFARPADDSGVANGETAKKGALVLDFGVSGDGFVETTTLDPAGSPYQQIVTWDTHPWEKSIRTRLGSLDGIAGIGDEWGLFAGSITDKQYFLASDVHFELHGIDLMLYDGAVNTVKIDHTGLSFAMGAALPTGYMTGSGIWMGKDTAYKMRVGSVSGGILTQGFSWDGTDFAIKGNVTAITGLIGGWTINSAYLAKDTGTDATSSGMSPTDYPYYAGATYANRASANFRITPDGALTALGVVELGTQATGTFDADRALAIKDNQIYEPLRAYDDASSGIDINKYGYQGGQTVFRVLNIYDGKGNREMSIQGLSHRVVIDNNLYCPGTALFTSTTQFDSTNVFNGNTRINAQLSIDGTPDAYAALDINSSTKALRVPRLDTDHRTAITKKAGMIVYDYDIDEFCGVLDEGGTLYWWNFAMGGHV